MTLAPEGRHAPFRFPITMPSGTGGTGWHQRLPHQLPASRVCHPALPPLQRGCGGTLRALDPDARVLWLPAAAPVPLLAVPPGRPAYIEQGFLNPRHHLIKKSRFLENITYNIYSLKKRKNQEIKISWFSYLHSFLFSDTLGIDQAFLKSRNQGVSDDYYRCVI